MALPKKQEQTPEHTFGFAPTAAESACQQMVDTAIANLDETIRSKREAREKAGHLIIKLQKLAGSL